MEYIVEKEDYSVARSSPRRIERGGHDPDYPMALAGISGSE
jgi:hypothetical protein